MRQIQQLQDEVHQKGTQATRATQKAENALNLNRQLQEELRDTKQLLLDAQSRLDFGQTETLVSKKAQNQFELEAMDFKQ